MDLAILILQLGSTLAMAGLIWFVQLVHYPLFSRVGPREFPAYEAEHVRRSGWLIVPLMVTELASALLLAAVRPAPIGRGAVFAGLILLLVLWGSTFLVQVPLHRRLEGGHDAAAQALLVATNWIRTAGWTARAVLVLYMTALTIC